MKKHFLPGALAALFAGAVLTAPSCKSPVLPGRFVLELPPLPPEWEGGRWRVEWAGPQGPFSTLEAAASSAVELDLIETWSNPVLAFPFWPEGGIPRGVLRPAGALYPLDARGGRLVLSWRGGVEAWFYRCLQRAVARNPGSNEKRRPEYFDWPRFRALLDSLPEEASTPDALWELDWPAIAEKTLQSGFPPRGTLKRKREQLMQ